MESEKMNSKANANDAAEWMLQMLDKRGSLPQDEAASSIKKNFGDEFVYENDSGRVRQAVDQRRSSMRPKKRYHR
jgi:hypothetical protein